MAVFPLVKGDLDLRVLLEAWNRFGADELARQCCIPG